MLVRVMCEGDMSLSLFAQVPVGQVTEDMTTKPLLETQCRFWQVADKAAGKVGVTVPDCFGWHLKKGTLGSEF